MPATLSQIRAWSTEHLIESAGFWTETADRWEDAFLTMRNQSHSVTWQGSGGAGLRQRTGDDLSVVSGKADQLRQAAGIARSGASDISAAQRRVLYGVEDAQNAGFTVGEDLSVIDTRSTSPAERVTRQAQAEAFAADIRLRAEQLDAAEVKVAGQLTAAAGGLSSGGFSQTPGGQAPGNNGGQSQPGPNGSPSKAPTTSGNGGQSQTTPSDVQPQSPTGSGNGVRMVDYTQNASGPNPPSIAPWDKPDASPPSPSSVQQYEQALTQPPAPTPAQPAPMPAYTGHPPVMTAAPPGPPFDVSNDSGVPAEQNPEMGSFFTTVLGGCTGGGALGGMIAGPILPADVATVPGGCVAGAIGTGSLYLGGIWLNNMFNGQG